MRTMKFSYAAYGNISVTSYENFMTIAGFEEMDLRGDIADYGPVKVYIDKDKRYLEDEYVYTLKSDPLKMCRGKVVAIDGNNQQIEFEGLGVVNVAALCFIGLVQK